MDYDIEAVLGVPDERLLEFVGHACDSVTRLIEDGQDSIHPIFQALVKERDAVKSGEDPPWETMVVFPHCGLGQNDDDKQAIVRGIGHTIAREKKLLGAVLLVSECWRSNVDRDKYDEDGNLKPGQWVERPQYAENRVEMINVAAVSTVQKRAVMASRPIRREGGVEDTGVILPGDEFATMGPLDVDLSGGDSLKKDSIAPALLHSLISSYALSLMFPDRELPGVHSEAYYGDDIPENEDEWKASIESLEEKRKGGKKTPERRW